MPHSEATGFEEITTDARDISYAVEFRSGKSEVCGSGTPRFTLVVTDESQLRGILEGDSHSAAMAFIRGQFDVSGDLIAALRLKDRLHRTGFLDWFWTLAAGLAPARIETWIQSRTRAARNIRFHYDLSNAFYRQFLDSRLVYSDACFRDPHWSLEQAQEAKLDGICRDLDLRPDQRFLDIGCGWGALLIHAAERYRARATGCTLSHNQYEFANSSIQARGLAGEVRVLEMDYREIGQPFDKIASIGMFEHVGRHRLGEYFHKIYRILEPGGRFLNSGICRPQGVGADPQTWFLLRNVFPGGELAHLSDVIREAERAGFCILDIRSVREDYARTCREWVARLRKSGNDCIRLVGERTYRTWLLYLAASAFSFESRQTEAFSLLMSKS